MKNFPVKKYLPDTLIIIGTVIISYQIFYEPPFSRLGLKGSSASGQWEIVGITLIVIGVIMAVRRYLSNKNEKLS